MPLKYPDALPGDRQGREVPAKFKNKADEIDTFGLTNAMVLREVLSFLQHATIKGRRGRPHW